MVLPKISLDLPVSSSARWSFPPAPADLAGPRDAVLDEALGSEGRSRYLLAQNDAPDASGEPTPPSTATDATPGAGGTPTSPPARRETDAQRSRVNEFLTKARAGDPATLQASAQQRFLQDIGDLARQQPQLMGELIEILVAGCFERPQVNTFWKAMFQVAAVEGTCDVVEGSRKKSISLREAVNTVFWRRHHAVTSDPQRVVIASALTRSACDRTTLLYAELVVHLIRTGSLPVRSEIQKVLGEIDDGMRDRRVMELFRRELIKAAEKECGEDDRPDANDAPPRPCEQHLDQLYAAYRPYRSLVSVSLGVMGRSVSGIAGPAVSEQGLGLLLSGDRMLPADGDGNRLFYGLSLGYGPGIFTAGARFGVGRDLGQDLGLRGALESGYLRLSGEERLTGDVPVQIAPINGGVNADGTAYLMQPHVMDRTIHAASLTFNPQIDYALTRSRSGEGNDFSLLASLGFHGGLFVGGLGDDGCSYAYTPDGLTTVAPASLGTYEIGQASSLGSRCRSGAFTFGSLWGADVKLTGEF